MINNSASKKLTAMLLVTAFITGASVLVIEIIGSRVLAPFFGSGIYTWSSLIAITLGALALGYAIGGRLVDHFPRPDILYGICLVAGLWTMATPWLASIVLPSLVQLSDVRLGVLLSCCLLFFPNIFLLGAVCPFVIRLISSNNTTPGSISGRVFSISTLGSLLAALSTGFLLVPNFGVQQILYLCGITLIMLVVTSFFLLRAISAGLISLAILFIAAFVHTNTEKTPNNSFELLETKPSFYGQLQVIKKSGMKMLLVDGIGQNYVMENGAYTTPYIDFMASLPLIRQAPDIPPVHGLVIGLGVGQLPMSLKQAGIDIDAVEIDPSVAEMAKKYFDFTIQDDRLHFTDGRLFLTRSKDHYEYIVIDAFNADQIAWHLLSKEALETTRQHMTNQGLLVINLTSNIQSQDVASVQHTLQTVFPHVRSFSDDKYSELASFVFVASLSPIHLSQESSSLNVLQATHVQQFIAGEIKQLNNSNGVLLTDNFNPIDQQRRQVELIWRRHMWDYLGKDQLGQLFL